MDEIPMLSFWRGQNVDEMTREQAIEALKECGRILHDRQEDLMRAWNFNHEILRRG